MKKGFTLVELLLVVTILGILVAVAIPKLFPQSERARVAEAIGILVSIRQAEQAYFLENDRYLRCNASGDSHCWVALGMEDPNSTARYFSFDIINVSAPGVIPATFTARATRVAFEDPGGGTYTNTIITLDQNGNYGGNHPFRPT